MILLQELIQERMCLLFL